MIPITIIGMGMSLSDLTDRQLAQIRKADILIGAERHLNYFTDVKARKKTIDRDIKGIADYIKDRMGDHSIVVLASGDPLFYGIGAYLSRTLGADQVIVHPNITAVAAAFARIKEAWHDAVIVSLHGRQHEAQFLESVRTVDKLAVLTDPHFHPAYLAQKCVDAGLTDLRMCVLERLGTEDERVTWFTPSQAVGLTFTEPNLVVFRRAETKIVSAESLRLGLPEELYDHERGLITKSEIRAVTISKLNLEAGHVIWDLGAGSGSIGIEASIFVNRGRIIAVEKNPKRAQQIEHNLKRFNVRNLEVVQGVLPAAMNGLPRPDRVFIGGGGKDLAAIVRKAARRLQSRGIIVVNTVLLPNLMAVITVLEELGFQTETVQVQINRGQSMPWGRRFDAENPVWIITGKAPTSPAVADQTSRMIAD